MYNSILDTQQKQILNKLNSILDQFKFIIDNINSILDNSNSIPEQLNSILDKFKSILDQLNSILDIFTRCLMFTTRYLSIWSPCSTCSTRYFTLHKKKQKHNTIVVQPSRVCGIRYAYRSAHMRSGCHKRDLVAQHSVLVRGQ